MNPIKQDLQNFSMPAYFLPPPMSAEDKIKMERFENVKAKFKNNVIKMPHENDLSNVIDLYLHSLSLHPTTLEIVKYKMMDWNNVDDVDTDFLESMRRDDIEDRNCNVFLKISDKVNRIVLINLSGGNRDIKGGGCGNIFNVWDFYYETDFTNKTSFLDFAKLIYRMKSNKYDNWYELYSGFESHIEDSTLYIAVSFDHGS